MARFLVLALATALALNPATAFLAPRLPQGRSSRRAARTATSMKAMLLECRPRGERSGISSPSMPTLVWSGTQPRRATLDLRRVPVLADRAGGGASPPRHKPHPSTAAPCLILHSETEPTPLRAADVFFPAPFSPSHGMPTPWLQVDVGDASDSDIIACSSLICGAPTWHTGADEQRSGTAWYECATTAASTHHGAPCVFVKALTARDPQGRLPDERLPSLDMTDKKVAIFGLGDQAGYGDNFCDAMGELHDCFSKQGAR
eukprot:CAMPEP_0118987524 /NCGR_PEP_ID=MMETSP1173-20130426/44333_1 /TAXON_ID=1034831 /ORGANISM="Rhizochromulina marina cf, Strain CCMP1243" /LENGTH=259 /DNA_ID=CAMNT_0006938381 /DNA_START=84 /DNA_END=867 /DNA_ORIENTATION=+